MMNKDPYLQENGVLKNLLGITDGEELFRAEQDITFMTIASHREIIPDKVDFKHLKAIHKHIFGDIYAWAGQLRTIPVEKPEEVLGGDTVRYPVPSEIEKNANAAIADLEAIEWGKLSTHEKAEQLAQKVAKVWQTHPFREGNTRVVAVFMAQFAEVKGFSMDVTLFRQHPVYTRRAFVKASDGPYSEYQYLTKIIEDSINKGPNKLKPMVQRGARQ